MLKGFKKADLNGKRNSGVMKLLIGPAEAIANVVMDTADKEAIKTITLKSGQNLAKYEFMEDECEFQENYKTENGISSLEQKVIFKLPGMSAETRNAVEEISRASATGLVAAVVRANKALIVGWDEVFENERPLHLNTTAGTTGKKLTDASGEELTLSRETTVKAHYYIGDISVLAPAQA